MDHLSFSPHPQGEIKARVKFALGTLAAGLSTSPLHANEAATQERVFVNNLGQAGAGSAFRIGQMRSGSHEDHLLFLI
jgi:hypothetical protein